MTRRRAIFANEERVKQKERAGTPKKIVARRKYQVSGKKIVLLLVSCFFNLFPTRRSFLKSIKRVHNFISKIQNRFITFASKLFDDTGGALEMARLKRESREKREQYPLL